MKVAECSPEGLVRRCDGVYLLRDGVRARSPRECCRNTEDKKGVRRGKSKDNNKAFATEDAKGCPSQALHQTAKSHMRGVWRCSR